MGGCHFLLTLQFNHTCYVCGKSKVSFITYYSLVIQSFELAMKGSHQSLYSTKTFYICIFLIHSDRGQKLLSALLKLAWNT